MSNILILTIYGEPIDPFKILQTDFTEVEKYGNVWIYKAIVDNQTHYSLLLSLLGESNRIMCTTYREYRSTYLEGQLWERISLL